MAFLADNDINWLETPINHRRRSSIARNSVEFRERIEDSSIQLTHGIWNDIQIYFLFKYNMYRRMYSRLHSSTVALPLSTCLMSRICTLDYKFCIDIVDLLICKVCRIGYRQTYMVDMRKAITYWFSIHPPATQRSAHGARTPRLYELRIFQVSYKCVFVC